MQCGVGNTLVISVPAARYGWKQGNISLRAPVHVPSKRWQPGGRFFFRNETYTIFSGLFYNLIKFEQIKRLGTK
ncbi:MAG: hypothetical protein PUF10_00260 [Bacteroidales bacterium]|nr:hypothetical protein [Bacteroidales bacterium]